jgi:hypothetical protein
VTNDALFSVNVATEKTKTNRATMRAVAPLAKVTNRMLARTAPTSKADERHPSRDRSFRGQLSKRAQSKSQNAPWKSRRVDGRQLNVGDQEHAEQCLGSAHRCNVGVPSGGDLGIAPAGLQPL